MGTLTLITTSLSALSGYLFGSINTAVIVSRLMYKDDVRKHGSGNAGTTNVGRTYGVLPGMLTLAGDFLKTLIAMLIGGLLADSWGKLIAFVACFIGHCYPLFFNFKGGKGVSVCFCAALMLDWRLFAVMLAAFSIVMLITQIVSASSILAVLSLIPACFAFRLSSPPILIASFFAFLTVTYAHRSNLKRLIDGKEPKFKFKK